MFNSAAASFQPLAPAWHSSAVPPAITEPSLYMCLTTAQLNALGLSSIAVGTSPTSVLSGTKRNTITLIVPSDQSAVTVGNSNGIQAPSVNWPRVQATFVPAAGYTIVPGNSIQLSPCNDPVFATIPTGVSMLFYVTS